MIFMKSKKWNLLSVIAKKNMTGLSMKFTSKIW